MLIYQDGYIETDLYLFCIGRCMCTTACVWRSGDPFGESVLSFYGGLRIELRSSGLVAGAFTH